MKRFLVTFLVVVLSAFSQLTAFCQTPQSIRELRDQNSQLKQLYRDGRYGEAVNIAEKIRSLAMQNYGPDHPDTAMALENLAEIYEKAGRRVEANNARLEAEKIRKRIMGKQAPVAVLDSIRRPPAPEAKPAPLPAPMAKPAPLPAPMAKPAPLPAPMAKPAPPPEPKAKAPVPLPAPMAKPAPPPAPEAKAPAPQASKELRELNSQLKQLYRDGRYGEAADIAERIRSLAVRTYGAEHADTAMALENLAEIYEKAGRNANANNARQEAEKIRTRIMGKQAPVGVLDSIRLPPAPQAKAPAPPPDPKAKASAPAKDIAVSEEAKNAGAAFPSQKTVKLKIPGSLGGDMATTVRITVQRIEGVKSVVADNVNSTATITFDDKRTNLEVIRKELTQAGYPPIGRPEYIDSAGVPDSIKPPPEEPKYKELPVPPPKPKAEAPEAKSAPAPAPAKAVSAFWNTWFENRDEKTRVEVLEKDATYSLVLDISKYAYFSDSSANADLSVKGSIEEAIRQEKTTIRFRVRPILHGDILRFPDEQQSWEDLTVKISKLVRADKDIEVNNEKKRDKLSSGEIKLRDFAQEVQAGEVRFDLFAEQAGDATIFITIWDEKGKIPLDHMSVSVQVVDAATPIARRRPMSVTFPLKAGRQTLLNISSDFSTAGPLIADAAFYIFEKSPNKKSMVFFSATKEAATPGESEKVSVYAWETVSLLSNYIEDRLQLIKLIRDARQKAMSRDENIRKYSYQLVAEELREKIFSGLNERDQKQATAAEKVFRDLVQQKSQRSIVFARMRNEDGNPVYLPLGILAASSSSRILDKRIILVQPLPREHYPADKHPVNAWTFNVPNTLPELEALTNTELSQLQKNPPYHRDIAAVRTYFEEIGSQASDASPEGVMLLSHQAGGNLWFMNDADRITTEDIKRQFPAGSVAVLSACSAASSEGNNQAILERLNNNGIDAMIISPFPVDAEYGAVLAIHFVQAIENAKKNSQELSVAELFSMASEQTAKHFMEKQTINFEDMDLEFLIAGDYRIRIAPQ